MMLTLLSSSRACLCSGVPSCLANLERSAIRVPVGGREEGNRKGQAGKWGGRESPHPQNRRPECLGGGVCGIWERPSRAGKDGGGGTEREVPRGMVGEPDSAETRHGDRERGR